MTRMKMMAALAAVLVAVLTQTGSAQSGQRLNKQELHSLMAKAMTVADHQKLAAHYKSEGDRLLAEAKDHEEMAEMYKKSPHPLTQKHPMAVGEAHCRYVAKKLREAAARVQTMAVMHENIAKKPALR